MGHLKNNPEMTSVAHDESVMSLSPFHFNLTGRMIKTSERMTKPNLQIVLVKCVMNVAKLLRRVRVPDSTKTNA